MQRISGLSVVPDSGDSNPTGRLQICYLGHPLGTASSALRQVNSAGDEVDFNRGRVGGRRDPAY
jgi:hypothetical protein